MNKSTSQHGAAQTRAASSSSIVEFPNGSEWNQWPFPDKHKSGESQEAHRFIHNCIQVLTYIPTQLLSCCCQNCSISNTSVPLKCFCVCGLLFANTCNLYCANSPKQGQLNPASFFGKAGATFWGTDMHSWNGRKKRRTDKTVIINVLKHAVVIWGNQSSIKACILFRTCFSSSADVSGKVLLWI